MATLLYGSGEDNVTATGAARLPAPRDTDPLPMNATTSRMPAAPSSASPSMSSPLPGVRPPATFTGVLRGLGDAAAIWAGLALFLMGLVFPMSMLAHLVLVFSGGWLLAAGIAFALTERPEVAA